MAAILSHTTDEVGMVTLNRPHRLNAMDRSLVRELNVALCATHAARHTRAVAALERVTTRAPWPDIESVMAPETDAVVGGVVYSETTTCVAASVPRTTVHQP